MESSDIYSWLLLSFFAFPTEVECTSLLGVPSDVYVVPSHTEGKCDLYVYVCARVWYVYAMCERMSASDGNTTLTSILLDFKLFLST